MSTEATSTETTIKAAMSVARDVAEGKLSPDELGGAAADECRELFGIVAGSVDPLWPLHIDVARQVLALGGVSADELSEWTAVARRREQPEEAVKPAEARDDADPPDVPADADSSVSGPHSPDSGDDEPNPEPGMDA